ncbi:MAG: GMC family oxidoreductase N-terminal domain-containing protein [Actinobacteria bacterium]|nr:GMC family oxidoreductase N-terminal domain-containing protein [Actinomycetota bacterium]
MLTQTLVTRVMFERDRAAGVEAVSGDRTVRFRAAREVVLSLGAVQTPKILMQSGIGPARHLESSGIGVRADLPGVGANLDDHLLVGCVWQAGAQQLPPPPRAQAVCFWGTDGRPASPKFIMYSAASAFMSPEAEARYGQPEPAFTFLLGMRLRSRGSVRLAGADPASAPVIETGYFDEPADLRDAVEAYRFAASIAGAEAMRPYRGSRAVPGTCPTPRSPPTSGRRLPPSDISAGPPGWAPTMTLSSILSCASGGWRAFASPTRQYCPG